MSLFWKLSLLEFVSTVLIVACTRAYVEANTGWALIIEAVFVTQWFYSTRLIFNDARAREWDYGFWAYQIGALAGVAVGIWGSKHLLGR